MDLKEGKSYIVSVTTKFEGKFSHFETDQQGTKFAVFTQTGRTDRGNIPRRRVKVSNIAEVELWKNGSG